MEVQSVNKANQKKKGGGGGGGCASGDQHILGKRGREFLKKSFSFSF